MGATRIRVKYGDIFKLKISEDNVRYLQYVANDINLLNGDVIRVFKRRYTDNDTPSPDEIVDDEVDLYFHVFLKKGVEIGSWTKYGHSEKVGDMKKVYFKEYIYELTPAFWFVWTIYREWKFRRLPKRFQSAYWGTLFQPDIVVRKITTGRYYEVKNICDDNMKCPEME